MTEYVPGLPKWDEGIAGMSQRKRGSHGFVRFEWPRLQTARHISSKSEFLPRQSWGYTYCWTDVHKKDRVLNHLSENYGSAGRLHLNDRRSRLCMIAGFYHSPLFQFVCTGVSTESQCWSAQGIQNLPVSQLMRSPFSAWIICLDVSVYQPPHFTLFSSAYSSDRKLAGFVHNIQEFIISKL